MGRQMCAIEIKYGYGVNFKPIVNMLTTTENFTLLEIGCKESIIDFIVQNFKLEMTYSPWVYDPPREITKIIRSNKKHPNFAHEPSLMLNILLITINKKLRCPQSGKLEL